MKKIFSKAKIALFLALILSVTVLLSGCGSLTGTIGNTIKGFKGERSITISSQELDMYIETKIRCDNFTPYFVDNFNFGEENKNLRKFCFVSLMDAHDVGVVSYDVNPNTDETENTKFLTDMGFEGIKEYAVGSDATTDTNDTVAMVISNKYVGKKSNGIYQYFVNVSLCGTQGSSEWISNFDFGSDTADYTGSHPDWTDKFNHKGFDVAANRVIDVINDYFRANPMIQKSQVVLAISGYSHGAAVANLVGAKIADSNDTIYAANYKAVTYTFATPRTTLKDTYNDTMYNTIHNYYNEEDVVANLPTTAMGYKRYGKDHPFTIQNNEKNKTNFNNQVDKIKERNAESKATYYDASCAPTIIATLNKLLENRNDVYTLIQDEAHKTYSLGNECEYATPEEAQQAGDDFLAARAAEGYGRYFADAGITKEIHTVQDGFDDDALPIYVDVPYYIWHCYVGDGVLVEVFTTTISCALSGDKANVMSKRYLVTYSKHIKNFDTIVNQMLRCPSYFGNAHNPLATYMGCIQE